MSRKSKTLKWSLDKFASAGYNRACEFEIVLLNLGVVIEDYQWDIEDVEKYSTKYSGFIAGVCGEFKRFCKETGGVVYSDSEFSRRFKQLNDGIKVSKIRFGSNRK